MLRTTINRIKLAEDSTSYGNRLTTPEKRYIQFMCSSAKIIVQTPDSPLFDRQMALLHRWSACLLSRFVPNTEKKKIIPLKMV